jgi:NAD(P)H-dependent FMN reductase
MSSPKILAFAGALRSQSWNKKLIREGARAAEAAGAEVTLIDLRDYAMPLYDGDIEAEQGLPPGARALRALMLDCEGLLISCPEYNGSITAVLKNTIDWISRSQGNEPRGYAFKGKVCGLMAASPGSLGAARALLTVRQVLTTLGVLILPTQFALARAGSAFTEQDTLKDDAHRAAVTELTEELVRTITLLNR